MCVASPATGGPPRGVLLGTSAGGALYYVEPAAAIGPNNELGAAKGEAMAAEESVLWKLTATVIEAVDDLQNVLDVVSTGSMLRIRKVSVNSFPFFCFQSDIRMDSYAAGLEMSQPGAWSLESL